MAARNHQPHPNPGNSSPTLFLVMLGVILLSLLAFLVLRPRPAGSGTGHQSTPVAPR